MRQAGRYMPEFRKIRAKHSFLEVCHDPELASEVTLLPLRVFNFDAAILFSDILVIPEALQLGLRFEDHVGPIFERPLSSAKDIDQLPAIDVKTSLNYVAKTIKLLLPKLKVPLIGFCGAPFTLASYMIEGGSHKDLKKTKQWMLKDPDSFHRLLGLITGYTLDYMRLQAEAGVHAFQIFDSLAHALAHPQFREFSLPYLQILLKGFASSQVPVIVFCKGSSVFAPQIGEIHPSGISLDWNGHLPDMRKRIPSNIALQGNLDPDILYAPCKLLKREIRGMLQSMKGDPGYIFNLGHGMLPDISVDAVHTLVDTVQTFRVECY
jgi:uroporphyrinogen decarboxylase